MLKVMMGAVLLAAMAMADGPVVKTGQTAVYKTGDDGTYQKGLAHSYSRSATGVVTDNATGLQWQDDYIDNGGYIKEANWADAKTYCANLTLDGKTDWRLPTIEELVSITDKGRTNPAIDPVFQNVAFSDYWSSTTLVSDTSDAWVVDFSNGDDHAGARTNGTFVRCVRDGQ